MNRALAGGAIASLLACTATAALAQTVPAAAPAASIEAEPADIVVTAQLREQDATEVPIALAVLDGERLERLGLYEFSQMARFVPGFVVQNQSPNNPGFVMRGITSDNGSATEEPRVSVFQDGVSISKSRGSYVELFDMARIEVAKGPQSTLYGRGALIGAVNLVQNRAQPDLYAASGMVSYGNYDALVAEAMVNVPVGEGMAVRVAGRLRQRDGYVENLLGGEDFNSVDTKAVRASFHGERGGLTFDLIGNYQRDQPAGTAFKSIAFNPTDPATGTVIGSRSRFSGAALAPTAAIEGGRDLGLDRQVWGITGIGGLELGTGLKLTSITAFRRFDSLEVFDIDGLSLPILQAAEDARGKQFSQELRLNYESAAVSAFVGASYFHEEGTQRVPTAYDERIALAQLAGALNGGGAIPGRPTTDPAPAALFGNTAFTRTLLQGIAGSYGLALPTALAQGLAANLKPAHVESYTNGSRTDAIDVFGDVTLHLSDRFEIGAGLRYTHDDKRSSYAASVVNGRSILGGLIGALGQTAAVRDALLVALTTPGAANIPFSPLFPVPLFGISAQPTTGNGGVERAELDSGGFSWRATARFMPGADTSIYATYARGRRPQILSASGPAAPFAPATFEVLPSETVDSFEIGAKTALLNRTLFADGAVFFYQYDNFQTTVLQGTQFVTTNAGQAESYGFEGQVRWVPSDTLSVFATYGYNHSRFRSGIRDGNRFRLSPDHLASFGAIVGVPAGPGRITVSPSVTWQSKVFFDDDNDRSDLQQRPQRLVADTIVDEAQRGYALVNARIGYAAPDDAWRIEAFVENAFDQNYVIDAGNSGDNLGLPTFIAGTPRFYGVMASFRFGVAR